MAPVDIPLIVVLDDKLVFGMFDGEKWYHCVPYYEEGWKGVRGEELEIIGDVWSALPDLTVRISTRVDIEMRILDALGQDIGIRRKCTTFVPLKYDHCKNIRSLIMPFFDKMPEGHTGRVLCDYTYQIDAFSSRTHTVSVPIDGNMYYTVKAVADKLEEVLVA